MRSVVIVEYAGDHQVKVTARVGGAVCKEVLSLPDVLLAQVFWCHSKSRMRRAVAAALDLFIDNCYDRQVAREAIRSEMINCYGWEDWLADYTLEQVDQIADVTSGISYNDAYEIWCKTNWAIK